MTVADVKLRNITAGRAVVCERSTGWPLAEVARVDRARWVVTINGRPVAYGRTRAKAVRLARGILELNNMIRSKATP